MQSPFFKETHHRILLLSDDDDLGLAMGSDLGRLGLQLDHVSRFTSNKKYARSKDYDGIILDLDQNTFSPFHAFRDLYAFYSHIPIVVVGTKKMHYELLFAFMGGARDYLVKPVDSVSLKRICLQHFL